jgi:hypothetical protein
MKLDESCEGFCCLGLIELACLAHPSSRSDFKEPPNLLVIPFLSMLSELRRRGGAAGGGGGGGRAAFYSS